MKIKKGKIQAFTLSEMVVVLILTSIVVGMVFSVLSLVQKHMSGIQNNFNNNIQLNALEQSLWIDFHMLTTIKYDDLNDKLIFANGKDSISYEFFGEYIVKEQDTFYVPLKSKMMFFDGNQTESGQIDALKLETTKAMQNYHLFVFKHNDATSFMN